MDVNLSEIVGPVGTLLTKYAVDVVGALLILVAGWIVAGWARRATLQALKRSERLDRTLQPIIAAVVRYAVLIFVLVAVLAQFGVQTASIIAALGAIGLAIGLALQGTLSNVAAGVMLLVLRPFNVGDFISTGDVEGTVDAIGLFTSDLHTADGIYLSAPNAQIWNKPIKNYSRRKQRRLDIPVGIAYEDDVERAMSVLEALVRSDTRVLESPEPQVMVKELADSSVNLNIRCWVANEDYWPMLFKLTKEVKLRLDQEGISIPYPKQDLHIVGGDGKALRPGPTDKGKSAAEGRSKTAASSTKKKKPVQADKAKSTGGQT